MTFKLSFMRSRAFAATAVGLVLIAGGAVAQQAAPNIMQPIEWDKRRLEQLDRNVRRLERALTQRNAAGEPVLVEPDPEVVTLQGQFGLMNQRLEDLEATVRRINGDNERLTFQLDEAQRDTAALRARLLDAEARIEKLETAAELNAPIEAHSPTGDAAQDLAAAVQLMSSDRARGARALETVVAACPDTPQAREANSRLGDIRASSNDKAGAGALMLNEARTLAAELEKSTHRIVEIDREKMKEAEAATTTVFENARTGLIITAVMGTINPDNSIGAVTHLDRRLRAALRDVRDGTGSASAHALPSHCHKVGS
jgi:TolA-binding protein